MCVAVRVHGGVETFFQRLAVGGEAYDSQDDAGVGFGGSGPADAEEFGIHACVDAVAGCVARVAC